jgi:hypothetical protein
MTTLLNIEHLSDNFNSGEISGSHGGEYEDDGLWDFATCSLVKLTNNSEVFTAYIIRAIIALMMEAASTS